MADMSEVCACGHSIYQHKSNIFGSLADKFREQDGTDCESRNCVCLGFNSVLETSDARAWRSTPDPLYNFGKLHPLTRTVTRIQGSNRIYIVWDSLICDSCFQPITPSTMTPVNDSVYCDGCAGNEIMKVIIERR